MEEILEEPLEQQSAPGSWLPKMIRSLVIQRLVLLDVVRPGDDEASVTLEELPEDVSEVLLVKLLKALGSRNAYELEFDPQTNSPVPSMIRDYTLQPDSAQFRDYAVEFVRTLRESQPGGASTGLLAVVEGEVELGRALVLVKLERESGLRLRPAGASYSLEAVRDLVLTETTKLWKCALFARIGAADSDIVAVGCDKQQGWGKEMDIARFWLGFLGCRLADRPALTTRRFYDAVVDFADATLREPEQKEEVYHHLLSQVASKKEQICPEDFARDFVPEGQEEPFLGFLEQRGVQREAFDLDTAAIKSKLKIRRYVTRRGARISAPIESEDWLEVWNDRIVINDQVIEID